jgi:hypothetical protein
MNLQCKYENLKLLMSSFLTDESDFRTLPTSIGNRRTRKPKPDFETWQVVNHFDLSSMETGNGGDNAEPEAIPGCAATPFEPVKTLENMSILVSGNSRPVIGYRNEGSAVAMRNLNRHLPRVTAMLDGIVDEIGNCIEQEISISRDEYALIPGEREMPAAFFRDGIEQLHDPTRNLG